MSFLATTHSRSRSLNGSSQTRLGSVREDSWSVFERIRASMHMARADVICPARKNFELRDGRGGDEGGGTLHNECSLMNAAAPFLSRTRFLVARLLTAFMVTRANSRKIIYFVTTIFKKKKNRIFPTPLIYPFV